MKNLTIKKIENIENINQNLNIPVGQIVLININKNRESLVQQEPLEQIDIELKKDNDLLTKTKNTFTDKKLTNQLSTINQQSNIQNLNNKTVKSNVYQTPKIIELNKKNVIQDVIQYQFNQQQNLNQNQLLKQQSTKSLNHHYEQPNLLNKIISPIIRSNDRIEYDIIDGQSTKINKPHYEKPIFNKNKKAPSPIKQLTIPKNNQLLDDSEINQIEFFYRSQRTFVYVSRSMANLYFTETDLINNGRYSSPRAEWSLSRTGIPVLLFNKGGTKCRLKRQIRIALAERYSGFTMFSDVIDNLSDYKKMHDNFHTFYLSIDHRKMAGLSFDLAASADEFLKQIESITSNPANISLKGPKFSKKAMMNSRNQLNKCKSIKNSIKKFKKSDISMPCLFQHITNLNINDFDRLYSLSTLVKSINYPIKTTTEDNQQYNEQLSDNLSKLSIDDSNNSTDNKQIYLTNKLQSSICSYSSSSSPISSSISPSSNCSYTSDDHS